MTQGLTKNSNPYPINLPKFLVEMEFDLDKALEEVPIHIEDPQFLYGRVDKRTSGFMSELPSEEGKKLEHFTKLRPKRNKKQQPTQAAVSENVAEDITLYIAIDNLNTI